MILGDIPLSPCVPVEHISSQKGLCQDHTARFPSWDRTRPGTSTHP
jgi:hypothetical protein